MEETIGGVLRFDAYVINDAGRVLRYLDRHADRFVDHRTLRYLEGSCFKGELSHAYVPQIHSLTHGIRIRLREFAVVAVVALLVRKSDLHGFGEAGTKQTQVRLGRAEYRWYTVVVLFDTFR